MFFTAMSGARCQGGDYDHPIVFIVDGDPIALGLVVCLNRPGGSITAYRGSGERPTATTPPTSVLASLHFQSRPRCSQPERKQFFGTGPSGRMSELGPKPEKLLESKCFPLFTQ